VAREVATRYGMPIEESLADVLVFVEVLERVGLVELR
jgi:hypothetical protein